MAVTKILAKHARLDVMVKYALNGDKTQEQILTAYQNCTPNDPYRQMMDVKESTGKTDGVLGYHIIQSFAKDEITPEKALLIAAQFVQECLPGYQAVIGTHTNKDHIHNHIVFNSVNMLTGEKYHSNYQTYMRQIREVSDRLCRENGLSIIITGDKKKTVHYAEWLREQRGQPTFKSMLEADMRRAIDDANDYGHFLMLMENMGYEADHGNNLGFRLRGQEHFMRPGRRNVLFTEEGIRAAIQGNLEAIEAGLRPVMIPRRQFIPYKKHPKYTGFMALYVHYLYLLGKIEKKEYPPKMTPHLKIELMKFEKYKAQFAFLREHGISTKEQMAAYRAGAEERLAALIKERTILNVQKKKRMPVYTALADAEALRPAKALYDEGMTGIEDEFSHYMDAVAILEKAGVPRERLAAEKAEMYEKVAAANRDIRAVRKEISMCDEITGAVPRMERQIRATEQNRDYRNHEQSKEK